MRFLMLVKIHQHRESGCKALTHNNLCPITGFHVTVLGRFLSRSKRHRISSIGPKCLRQRGLRRSVHRYGRLGTQIALLAAG